MGFPSPPRELSRTEFVSELDALTAVYAAAMRPDPGHLPGRRSIMQQHASYRGFRALVVVADGSGQPDEARQAGEARRSGRGRQARRTHWARQAGRAGGAADGRAADGRAADGRAGGAGRIVGFGYSFSGEPGQWWHDVVAAALTARSGPAIAAGWLADSLEIAELHVHPDFHRRGIGRGLLLGLAAGRGERTAVLSTQDADSPARRLYRGVGFTDLLTAYNFPGSALAYAVMGATLPLRPTPVSTTPVSTAQGSTARGPATPGPSAPGRGWPAGPGGPAPPVPATGRSPEWPASR